MLTGSLFCFAVSLDYRNIVKALPFLRGTKLLSLYFLSSVVIFSGESNAVNLTDGLDGLAAGLFAIAAVGLAIVLACPLYSCPPLVPVCVSMSGACCGFLTQNGSPAKVRLGTKRKGLFVSENSKTNAPPFPLCRYLWEILVH